MLITHDSNRIEITRAAYAYTKVEWRCIALGYATAHNLYLVGELYINDDMVIIHYSKA